MFLDEVPSTPQLLGTWLVRTRPVGSEVASLRWSSAKQPRNPRSLPWERTWGFPSSVVEAEGLMET